MPVTGLSVIDIHTKSDNVVVHIIKEEYNYYYSHYTLYRVVH